MKKDWAESYPLMKTRKLHKWNLSYAGARQLQVELAGRVEFTPLAKRPKVVAGLDCAFSKDGERIIAAVEKLRTQPDLFMVDGQGVAHPRRLGLAAHLGLFFEKPTIGCAKSRLIGTYEEPPLEKGSYASLIDESRQSEVIGAVVRTRTNVKPLFISVGNKCTLDDAIEMTLACTTRYRLPEPTRLAHQRVSRLKPKV